VRDPSHSRDTGTPHILGRRRALRSKSPAVLVRVGPYGTPFFEAKWRDAGGNELERRLGRAWLEQGSEGE
jgi:hypothetical protein